VLQPQKPPLALVMHTPPIALPTHETHAPDEPHAPTVVPLAQVPLAQQPPLHGCVAEQPGVQACVARLHACPDGQSLAPLQPHAPAMHAWPALALLQSTQLPPDGPHAAAVLPGRQPPPWQQPPVHGIAAEHSAATHRCVVVSQVPVRQSPFTLQPHAPAMHAVPIELAAQLTHAAPLAPHSLAEVPAMQVPKRQQPPLHG
jgi:hypothetical protein